MVQHNNFGITYPAIDELLERVSSKDDQKFGSKFALASYGASRARQIVSYYSGLADGLLENVGPLVEYYQHEKPLSIAMREIHQNCLQLVPGDRITEE
jgi:DNA-directed RNA polymerase subunit omega